MAKETRFRRLTDSLGSNSILVPYIEKELVTKGSRAWPDEYPIRVQNKEREWDGYFHPSTHSVTPDLLLYYEFHPEYRIRRNFNSVDSVMNMQVGSAFHAMLQSMLIHMGYTTEEECEVGFINEEHNCTGSVDVRKVKLPNGMEFPLEIKSASWIPDVPYESYIKQFQIYMDIGCETPQDWGLMLFVQKSAPHKFKEVIIERDESILDEVYSKWARVQEAIEFDDPTMLGCSWLQNDWPNHVTCQAREVCIYGKETRRPTSV